MHECDFYEPTEDGGCVNDDKEKDYCHCIVDSCPYKDDLK